MSIKNVGFLDKNIIFLATKYMALELLKTNYLKILLKIKI